MDIIRTPPTMTSSTSVTSSQPMTSPPVSLPSPETDQLSHRTDSRPVIQYRKPGWRLRAFDFQSKVRNYPNDKIKFLSFAQMVAGFVCLCFSVAVIAVEAWGHQIGVGIWGGSLFLLAGGIGLVAYISYKLSFIFATFVLSVAAFIIAFVLFAVSVVGVGQDVHELEKLQENTFAGLGIHGLAQLVHRGKLKIGFNGVLLAMALIELMLSMAHALLSARHFFVWDEGCTSESPYVYSNEGADLPMADLPPTYQEAMRTSYSPGDVELQYRQAPVSSHGPEEPGPREERPGQRPRSEGPRMGPDYPRPISVDSTAPPQYVRPVSSYQRPSNDNQANSPDADPALRLGRGHPQGLVDGSPMYKRPQRAPQSTSSIENEPIYANVHELDSERPLSERPIEREGPPRPPYPGVMGRYDHGQPMGRMGQAQYRRPMEPMYNDMSRRPDSMGYPTQHTGRLPMSSVPSGYPRQPMDSGHPRQPMSSGYPRQPVDSRGPRPPSGSSYPGRPEYGRDDPRYWAGGPVGLDVESHM